MIWDLWYYYLPNFYQKKKIITGNSENLFVAQRIFLNKFACLVERFEMFAIFFLGAIFLFWCSLMAKSLFSAVSHIKKKIYSPGDEVYIFAFGTDFPLYFVTFSLLISSCFVFLISFTVLLQRK